MIGAYEYFKNLYLGCSMFSSPESIIPRHMHIMVIYEMVLKTHFRANISYIIHPNDQICMTLFSLMFSYMIMIHVHFLKFYLASIKF